METKQKKRHRSRAYPGVNLDESIQNLIKIKKSLGSKGLHDRNTLAIALGYSKATSAVNIKISALVQFGFLIKKGSTYSLSSDAKKITDPISEDEKNQEIKEAFSRPSLYSEILTKFSDEKTLPQQLSTHLNRFHGIADNASENAAKLFIESGTFAGVIDEDGNIILKPDSINRDDNEDTVENKENDIYSKRSDNQFGDQHLDYKAVVRKYVFPLSQGTAILSFPNKITLKDIEILKKYIEILELELE